PRNNHNILGYASMWLMVDEAHLTSIAVRETHRRRGVGELLLISIIDLAMHLKAQIVTLEVRSSNLAAQALYEKYGFIEVGLRRGYYSDDGEDAVIMTAENIASAFYQARLEDLRHRCGRRGGEDG
ncbi:ribosomal protein S18-alanine N-acetyltransferase, partial [Chloroflexota bacterium]